MIIEWFSKRAIKLSTNCFACSIKAGEFMFKDKEFFEMNNAIIVERYKDLKANKDINKEKFGFKKDDFIIGFIGRLESQKNVLFLPRVLKALKVSKPNAKLVIVGSGSDLEPLKEEVKSLDLVNDVVILEALPGILEILPTFDCFVMSSIFEGLPMVAVEAQTALIPCVLSTNITEETKFTNAVKFVSLEDDHSKWANAILEVTNMNNCYNDKDKFNINVQAKILIEKYKELIEINKNS
jgi:glycosyltransferase involved in cell wall biosynthesis